MNKYLAGLTLLSGLTYSLNCQSPCFDNNFLKFETKKELDISKNKEEPSKKQVIKKTRNNIIFTIDDGPSIYSKEIANTLDSLGYQGIFFMVTRGINEKTKKDLIEILKMGHHIGNHSFSHPNFQNLDLEQARYQILKSDSIINSVYKEAGIRWEKKYIRYPYGNEPSKQNKDEINKLLNSLNYQKPMFWRMDVDLLDRHSYPSDENIKKMKDDDIILLHERKYTPQTIREIVKSIDQKNENK
ncbi:MAG: polysaccharide deacetylase family protein [Candidatus Absconditabacterales bacterium]|nr:polysaccharide deacetylase family protein [Candidatus Absconditabacterales bacterium]